MNKSNQLIQELNKKNDYLTKQIKKFEEEEIKSKSRIEDLSNKIRQLEERLKTLPKETFNIENETTLERTKNLSSCNYNNHPVISNNSNYKVSYAGNVKTPLSELNTSYSWRLSNNQGLKNTIAASKARSKEKTDLKSRALSSNKEVRKPLISFKPSIIRSKYNNFSNYNHSYHNNTNCSNTSQNKGYAYNLGKSSFKKSFTNINSVTSLSTKKVFENNLNNNNSNLESSVENSKSNTSVGKFTNLYNKNFIENNEKKLRSNSFNKANLLNTNNNNLIISGGGGVIQNSNNSNSNNCTLFNYKSPALTPNKSYTHFFKHNTKNSLSVKNRSRITTKTPFQNINKNNFTKSYNLNSYRQSSNNNTNGSYNNSKNSNNLINSYFDFFNSMKAINQPSTYNSKQLSIKSNSNNNNNNSKYEEETTVINNTNKKLNIPNLPDRKKKSVK
jgi:hypothetical protein